MCIRDSLTTVQHIHLLICLSLIHICYYIPTGLSDVSFAETIERLKARNYIHLVNETYYIPGPIGLGLVEGYDSMDVILTEPQLCGEFEADFLRFVLI